eukprot:scaffold441509_cov10-Prasinocladus_malaysianus.AAC.1
MRWAVTSQFAPSLETRSAFSSLCAESVLVPVVGLLRLVFRVIVSALRFCFIVGRIMICCHSGPCS